MNLHGQINDGCEQFLRHYAGFWQIQSHFTLLFPSHIIHSFLSHLSYLEEYMHPSYNVTLLT